MVDRFFRKLAEVYDRRLRSLIRRPWLVMVMVGALIVLGALTFRPAVGVHASSRRGTVKVTIEGARRHELRHMYQYGLKLKPSRSRSSRRMAISPRAAASARRRRWRSVAHR